LRATILCPYTETPGENGQSLNPLTRQMLDNNNAGCEVRYIPIDPRHHLRYAELLAEAWLWPGDLIVVEHDIGITEHTVWRFLDCDQPWCGNAYTVGHDPIMALGCVKFSAHLKAMQPGLMDRARLGSTPYDGGHMANGDWRRLDGNVSSQLHMLGHTQHRHYPDVNHFHPYPR